jgi:hypothetical protein
MEAMGVGVMHGIEEDLDDQERRLVRDIQWMERAHREHMRFWYDALDRLRAQRFPKFSLPPPCSSYAEQSERRIGEEGG